MVTKYTNKFIIWQITVTYKVKIYSSSVLSNDVNIRFYTSTSYWHILTDILAVSQQDTFARRNTHPRDYADLLVILQFLFLSKFDIQY